MPTSDQIERWLIAQIAAESQSAPATIRSDQPVLAYGIESMQAVGIIARLEDWLGFRYGFNPLEEFSSITDLAEDAAARASLKCSPADAEPASEHAPNRAKNN